MKYYKLLGSKGQWPSFTPGKIYEETSRGDFGGSSNTVEYYAANMPERWKLVDKKEYLKQENMNKEIIGYKLKDDKYAQYVRELTGACNFDFETLKYNIHSYANSLRILKDAEVLDIWFNPLYKPLEPDITINGYKAEFKENYIKFGCAEINKELFLVLSQWTDVVTYSNRHIASVTIGNGTFTADQIKQIAEYYLNKE